MSDNKKTSVLGIYTSRSAVESAADTLVGSGFSASDISVLLPENLGPKPIATDKATKASGVRPWVGASACSRASAL